MKGPPGFYTKNYQFINCGGFHNGWTDGWSSSYVERAGFVPQPLSWAVLRLKMSQPNNSKHRAGMDRHGPVLDVEGVSRRPPGAIEE